MVSSSVLKAQIILNARKAPNPKGCNQYTGPGCSVKGRKDTKKAAKKKSGSKKSAQNIKPGGSYEEIIYSRDLGIDLTHLRFTSPPASLIKAGRQLIKEVSSNKSMQRAVDQYTSKTSSALSTASLKTLDRLASRTLPEEVVVYRGLGKAGPKIYGRYREGKSFTMTEKGFTSTSLDPGVTDTFKDPSSMQKYVLELKVRQGVYLEPVSSKVGEEEILLPRNTKIKITGADYKVINGSGAFVLIGEQI